MLKVIPLFRNFLGMIALSMAANGLAQDLPGSPVSDSAVDPSAITLVDLLPERYPELFEGPIGWRTFEGTTYKYFYRSGVYLGINGADLYFLGGPFGDSVQNLGTLADALNGLQKGGISPFLNTLGSVNNDFLIDLQAQGPSQLLPGGPARAGAISQNAETLVELDQKQYPEIFTGPTFWRTYSGFHYKYFYASGVYLGINGSDLYLLGGPFGESEQKLGTVEEALATLQGGSGSADLFNNVTTASTLLELLSYFQAITVSYGTTSSIANIQAEVALEAMGQEQVNGVTTDVIKLTLSGSNLATPNRYEMWVNAAGTIVKLRMNETFEYPASISNTIGAGLASGMLSALAAADAPAVRAALDNTLQDSAALSQNTEARTISGVNVQTLTLQISDGGSTTISYEISDFGAFSMATKMTSTLGSTTTNFEITKVVLR